MLMSPLRAPSKLQARTTGRALSFTHAGCSFQFKCPALMLANPHFDERTNGKAGGIYTHTHQALTVPLDASLIESCHFLTNAARRKEKTLSIFL